MKTYDDRHITKQELERYFVESTEATIRTVVSSVSQDLAEIEKQMREVVNISYTIKQEVEYIKRLVENEIAKQRQLYKTVSFVGVVCAMAAMVTLIVALV
jgi:hypothetical protein